MDPAASRNTTAIRADMKTLHGEWRTPMPITFVDDFERDVEGRRCYKGEIRDHVRVSVERLEKKVGDEMKVQRLITLRRFARNENGGVDLESEEFMMTGRANTRYDRIKWDNGCVWVRAGRGSNLEQARARRSITETEAQHSAAPPADFDTLASRKAILQPDAMHRAAPPDWQTTVAQVTQALKREMEEAEACVAKRKMMEAEAATAFATFAPQQGDEDMEVGGPPRRSIDASGEHGMLCCGSKPKTLEETIIEKEEVLPEARDLSEGFFGPDQVEDIVDRINDVVGIWGISEEKEREFIKPPVVAMNKLVKAAMEVFMNNPVMDLLSYIMDEAMDFSVKVKKLAEYIHEQFIAPLAAALVDSLSESFGAIEWIKDKVTQVIMMMSSMVSDEVVSTTVDTIGDSDIAD